MRVPRHDLGLVMCLTMSCLRIIYVSHSSCQSSSAKMAKSVFRNIRSVTTGASARTTRMRKIAVSVIFSVYFFLGKTFSFVIAWLPILELTSSVQGVRRVQNWISYRQFGLLTHSFASNHRNPSDANLQPHRLVIKFIRS